MRIVSCSTLDAIALSISFFVRIEPAEEAEDEQRRESLLAKFSYETMSSSASVPKSSMLAQH